MSELIKVGERLDDLEYNGLKLIQDPKGYCFTSDSVLLANLAKVGHKDRVADLCTGSGIVAILVAAKFSPKEVFGLEIQDRLADMAMRNVEFNGLTEKVRIINGDVREAVKFLGGNFDVVTVNPPYERKNGGIGERDIARYENLLTLEECVAACGNLLKFGGAMYMVHRARRLAEIIFLMKKYNIEPKKITVVYPKSGRKADSVIVEGKKGAKPDLIIPEPLVIYDENGEYTEQARRIYNK